MADYGNKLAVFEVDPLITADKYFFEFLDVFDIDPLIFTQSLSYYIPEIRTVETVLVGPAPGNAAYFDYVGEPVGVPKPPILSAKGLSVTVSWEPVDKATQYEVFRNGVSQGIVTSSPFIQTVVEGTYTYEFRAGNAADIWSPLSASKSITLDLTPPAVPAAPSASVSGSIITVTWTLVPDAVTYEFFRNGVSQGTKNFSPYIQTAVVDGTYSYTVRAKDGYGNWSAQSPVSNSVTVDTVFPDRLLVSGSAVGSTVTIVWSLLPSAILYEIFRDGVSQGTSVSSPFIQTVPNGTYSYTVRARDAQGWGLESAPPTWVTVLADVSSSQSSMSML